jgi:hypothetical protein
MATVGRQGPASGLRGQPIATRRHEEVGTPTREDRAKQAFVVEAPGIEPGSEAASHGTSTSVVPVLISP